MTSFNPAVIVYGILIFGYLVNCLVIVYHLLAYPINRKNELIMFMIFVLGSGLLLALNLFYAFKLDWGALTIYL